MTSCRGPGIRQYGGSTDLFGSEGGPQHRRCLSHQNQPEGEQAAWEVIETCQSIAVYSKLVHLIHVTVTCIVYFIDGA